MASEEQDIVVHYQDTVEVFDKDLQLTLSDIRGHFGVSGGSLKVGGKVKVVKPDVVVPSGTYVLDIPQRNQANPASTLLSTSSPAPPVQTKQAPTTTLEPLPIPKPSSTSELNHDTAIQLNALKEPLASTELPTITETKVPTKTIEDVQSSPKLDKPFSLKREIEPPVDIEAKKPKISESKPNLLSFGASHSTNTLPTKLMEQLDVKPLPKPLMDPSLFLPTFQQDGRKAQNNKAEDNSKQEREEKTNDKENYPNYDWKTKINISTTNSGVGSNRTSSVIASITSTSKPTTPERKRQKNEIITRILAREADRKTLRETFMNVEQIKEEMTEEVKSSMSSSEVLHLCEVSWFNKFRESGN